MFSLDDPCRQLELVDLMPKNAEHSVTVGYKALLAASYGAGLDGILELIGLGVDYEDCVARYYMLELCMCQPDMQRLEQTFTGRYVRVGWASLGREIERVVQNG